MSVVLTTGTKVRHTHTGRVGHVMATPDDHDTYVAIRATRSSLTLGRSGPELWPISCVTRVYRPDAARRGPTEAVALSTAHLLASEGRSNEEYDRALVELMAELYPLSTHSFERRCEQLRDAILREPS